MNYFKGFYSKSILIESMQKSTNCYLNNKNKRKFVRRNQGGNCIDVEDRKSIHLNGKRKAKVQKKKKTYEAFTKYIGFFLMSFFFLSILKLYLSSINFETE